MTEISQAEHARINAREYPGTRQLCTKCNQPTGRCEEDDIHLDGERGPLCESCAFPPNEIADFQLKLQKALAAWDYVSVDWEDVARELAALVGENRAIIQCNLWKIDNATDTCKPSYVGHKTLAWVPCCPLEAPCEAHAVKA